MIDIFDQLSLRLAHFGETERSREIIDRAIDDNPWFSMQEISHSIEAIRSEMLHPQRLEQWMAHYPTLPVANPKRVGVIMAGNIPLVGFFDMLCVLMAGHTCYVKPSSKDRILVHYIINELKDIDKSTPIYISQRLDKLDAVIATGGENANRHFKEMFADTKRLLRGSRHSVAVLGGEESYDQLVALGDDIYAYSGLGCRNIAMIFTPRGRNVELPRRETSQKYSNNYRQTRALLTLSDKSFVDNGSSCLVKSEEFPQSLSTISIYEYDSLDQVESWIEEHDSDIQCIVSELITHNRCVGFGKAQQPKLMDYPDAVDVMEFLNF